MIISCDWVTPLQLSGPAQSVWLSVVFVQHCGKQEGDGAPTRHLRDSDYPAQTPPQPPDLYPQLTSRRLPPECVPSSSHLLCFSTLTYCLEAGHARHSGPAWALCFRSSRRYLVDHATVEMYERQNDELISCFAISSYLDIIDLNWTLKGYKQIATTYESSIAAVKDKINRGSYSLCM